MPLRAPAVFYARMHYSTFCLRHHNSYTHHIAYQLLPFFDSGDGLESAQQLGLRMFFKAKCIKYSRSDFRASYKIDRKSMAKIAPTRPDHRYDCKEVILLLNYFLTFRWSNVPRREEQCHGAAEIKDHSMHVRLMHMRVYMCVCVCACECVYVMDMCVHVCN